MKNLSLKILIAIITISISGCTTFNDMANWSINTVCGQESIAIIGPFCEFVMIISFLCVSCLIIPSLLVVLLVLAIRHESKRIRQKTPE
jgi:hypothetical protein